MILQFLSAKAELPKSISIKDNLQITHTLFSVIISTYLDEERQQVLDQDSKLYSFAKQNAYLADEKLLASFLFEWQNLIDQNKYTSTEQIFSIIYTQKPFYKKYANYLKSLYDHRFQVFSLGGYRNQALFEILNSENLSFQQRIDQIFQIVNSTLIANSRDYRSAQLIMLAIEQANEPYLSKKAKDSLKNIDRSFYLSMSQFIFGLTGVVKTASNHGMIDYRSLYELLQNTKRTYHLAKNIGKLKLHQMKNLVNPYIPKDKALLSALIASTAAHGALFKYFSESKKNENRDEKQNSNAFADSLFPFALMWQTLFENRSYIFENASDLSLPVTEVLQWNQNQLAEYLKSQLSNGNKNLKENSFQVVIYGEKLLKIDGRKDDLIFDLGMQQFYEIRNEIYKSIGKEIRTSQDIELVRQKVIEHGLSKYQRDFPNLTSLSVGFGGNCVSVTMYFMLMLAEFQLSPHYVPMVSIYQDHIEPVIYDQKNQSYIELMNGKSKKRLNSILYYPQMINALILRQFVGEKIALTPFAVDEKDHQEVLNKMKSIQLDEYESYNQNNKTLLQKWKNQRAPGLFELILPFEGRAQRSVGVVAKSKNVSYSSIEDASNDRPVQFDPTMADGSDHRVSRIDGSLRCGIKLIPKKPVQIYWQVLGVKKIINYDACLYFETDDVRFIPVLKKMIRMKKTNNLNESSYAEWFKVDQEVEELNIEYIFENPIVIDLIENKLPKNQLKELTDLELKILFKSFHISRNNTSTIVGEYSMLQSIRSNHPHIQKYQRYLQIVNRWFDYWLRHPVELVKSLPSNESFYLFEEFISNKVGSVDKVNARDFIDKLSKSNVQICESGEVMPKGIDLPVSNYFGKKYVTSENHCQKNDQQNESSKGRFIKLSQKDLVRLMAMFQSGIQLWDLQSVLIFVQKMNLLETKPVVNEEEKKLAQMVAFGNLHLSHIEQNLERLQTQRKLTTIESQLLNEFRIFNENHWHKKSIKKTQVDSHTKNQEPDEITHVTKCKKHKNGISCQ